MQHEPDPPLADYPPAPWRARGGAWFGVFQADLPLALPSGLAPLPPAGLARRLVVVALVRYMAGTLRYDELIVASPARRGRYVGLYVHGIWVDDLASLWGGRRIWGLGKQLATFSWRGSSVAVADAHGPIVTLALDMRTALLPRLPLLMPAFGCRDGRWVFTLARTSARPGRAGMRLTDWSARFGYRLGTTPLLALAAKPMRSTVAAPTPIDAEQPG